MGDDLILVQGLFIKLASLTGLDSSESGKRTLQRETKGKSIELLPRQLGEAGREWPLENYPLLLFSNCEARVL